MLQIRTIIQGESKFIDLYQNEPILLSLSFAELQDITKKNSSYSKAFSVPGSKQNNEIFNFFFDLNSIPTTFNPNNKFEAQLLWDGYLILQGYIRLNGVTVANGEIIYQCTFYNQVGDLMANIGDKYLFDLDLSYLSHPYDDNVINYSNLDPNLFPLTGNTNYSYQNGKTFWGLFNIGYEYVSGTTLNFDETPLIQFTPVQYTTGSTVYAPVTPFFDYSGTPVHNYYFKPALQIRELYESIFREAGYQLQSEFMDTAYFKRFYMPLKFVDESIFSRNAIIPCYTYTNIDPTPTLSIYTPTYTNPSSGLTCNTLGLSANTTTLVLPEEFSGTYTFRFTFDVNRTQPCDQFSFIIPLVYLTFDDGTQQTVIYSNYFCTEPITTQVSFDQTFNFTGTSNIQFYFQGEYATISNFNFQIISSQRYIPTGSTVNYDIEFPDNDYKQIDFLTSINKYFNLVVVPNPDDPDKLIVEPIVDYIGKGDTLDWTTKIDFSATQNLYPTTELVNGTLEYEFRLDQDYANQDFKTQTNRIFGTDRFQLGLEYKDETTKFTYLFSSPIEITVQNAYVPLITLESMSKVKTIDKSGQTQQTFVPFKILPKVIFRGPTIPNDNYGLIGGTGQTTGSSSCTSGITFNLSTSLSYPPYGVSYTDCFGVQQDLYLYPGSNSIPGCADPSSLRQAVPYLPPLSITITNSGTTCGTVYEGASYQYWYMDEYQQDRWSNINRFTTYPFSYTGFSHYTNFRGEDRTNITPSEFSFIADDLYNVYYEDYVQDIISEENKIYSAKIYLYPQDIQKLRWNERIIINNTYFRINKISNFNALEPSICDIELVKLTREYQSHPVLYYDLIPCASGSTLYSNSDLMYNLYAYAGNYVKLFTDDLNYLGCYNVQIGQYDSTRTYNHYYLSSGYTQQLVGLYPDCGCTGRTGFNIIQEEPGDSRFFFFSGLSCVDSATTYNFVSTSYVLSGGSASYKIQNSATTLTECVYAVGQTYSSITDWIEISGYTDCTDCNYVPPTPTPTMTPTVSITPSNTPTVSITPSTTPCIECYETTFQATGYGLVIWQDCDGITLDYFVIPGETFNVNCGGGGVRYGTMTGPGTVTYDNLCSTNCITPTPTPTNQESPTPTPTIGTTPTPTPTVSITASNTPTPSPSASGTDLYIYAKYINNQSTGDLTYSVNMGTPANIGPITTSSCLYFYTINGLQIGDTVEFTDSNTQAIAGSTTVCPSGPGGFGCNYNHTVLSSGAEFVYITVDGQNAC